MAEQREAFPVVGLSPHLRGNPRHFDERRPKVGSIPAPAGKPRNEQSQRAAGGVYPRTCGETAVVLARPKGSEGLSPHLRGNPPDGPRHALHRRSIPAPAGKPRHTDSPRQCARVYPRTCGETAHGGRERADGEGLSPHLRGNRGGLHRPADADGSIPAPAGKPAAAPGVPMARRVYPRTCGET